MSQTIEATIVPAGTGPDIATMDRADAPAIWQSYAQRAEKLIAESKAIVVTDCSQVSLMKQADALRRECKSVRCEIERKRKEMTEGMTKQVKAINSEAVKLWDLFEAEEARLLEMATFAEREEARQKAELASAREAQILPLGGNPAMYKLGEMSEEEFQGALAGVKAAYQHKLAVAQKAKEEAEAKSKADEEERERQRQETVRLRQEAEAAKAERERVEAAAKAEREAAAKALREAQEKAERERAAAQAEALKASIAAENARKAAEAQARAEREAIEEKARKEREEAQRDALAQKEALEAKAHQERVAREKMEAELKAKLDAEEAEWRQREEAARQAAAAPDREKLSAFAAAIRAMPVPDLTTDAGKAVSAKLAAQTGKFATFIERQSAKL